MRNETRFARLFGALHDDHDLRDTIPVDCNLLQDLKYKSKYSRADLLHNLQQLCTAGHDAQGKPFIRLSIEHVTQPSRAWCDIARMAAAIGLREVR